MSRRESATKLEALQPLFNKHPMDRITLGNASLKSEDVLRESKHDGKDGVETALF